MRLHNSFLLDSVAMSRHQRLLEEAQQDRLGDGARHRERARARYGSLSFRKYGEALLSWSRLVWKLNSPF